ncbi:MAG: protein translocase subunit SecF, partial [Frankia sp.]|nr:protein translocase subunit SecF [Frankia sp.]
MSLASQLYRGETSFDVVGKRRTWYAVSGALMLISLVSLLFVRGLNLGIDFRGGAIFDFRANGHSVAEAQRAVSDLGIKEVVVQRVGSDRMRVQTPPLDNSKVDRVVNTLATKFQLKPGEVSPSTVGAKWGSQITAQALKGLLAFLVLVIAYISMRFEWKMAMAAIIALLHDLLITAGIYSVVGFEVTPSTVIALLTILGYSLYDTVVVFDKVRENTTGLAGGSRMSYTQAANLSVNQTIMRSINTSLTSLLPVGALLFVGAGLLG